jgi:L-lactate utilization protein LutC
MDENNYISIDKMQKEADEKFEKEVREHNAEVDAKRKARQDAENAEMQELYKGMAESIKAEQENQKSRELEEAVSKASKEVEDKYDNNSIIKSEKRTSMDNSYKNLLDGLDLND